MQSVSVLRGFCRNCRAMTNLPRVVTEQKKVQGCDGKLFLHTSRKVHKNEKKFGHWLVAYRNAQQDFAEEFLANLTPEMADKHRKILNVIDLTPDFDKEKITSADMMKLLSVNSVTKIQNRLAFLQTKQMKKKRKEEEMEQREMLEKKSSDSDITTSTPEPEYRVEDYNFNRHDFIHYMHFNHMFGRAGIWTDIYTILHGHPFVLDMGYNIDYTETDKLFQQMMVGQTKSKWLHIHATGFHRNDFLMHLYKRKVLDNMLINFNKQDFWELYPRKNLVYLTPDGPMLRNYNPSDIYVVGFLGKESEWNEYSLCRARELGIRHGAFPIYAHFQKQAEFQKNLDLTTTIRIVMETSKTKSWKDGLFKVLPDCYAKINEPDEALAAKWRLKPKKKNRNVYLEN